MITDEEYSDLMAAFFSDEKQPKEKEEYKIYVAYGSNINTQQMKFRCPDATIYDQGMVQDYELSFNKVATLLKKKGEEAPALLWKLSSSDERSLDKFEGYPHKYKKIAVDVKCGDEIVSGMAYVMVNSKDYNTPKDEYYQRIEKGYIENGLPLEYLEQAFEKTEEKMCERIERDEDIFSLYNREYLDYISNNDDAIVRAFRMGAMYQQYFNENDLEAFEIIDMLKEYKTVDSFERELKEIEVREQIGNLYCAYGSNMDLEQMRVRCPNSKVVAVGNIEDYKLQFNRHATIVKQQDKNTPVVVWEIAPQDWKKLDRYEGCPSYYRKELVNVNVKGVERAALVYVMNAPDFALSPPSPMYLEGIKQGCKQHGIDTSYLNEAFKESVAAVSQRKPRRQLSR